MPYPQSVIWAAMHQDYAEGFVADEMKREGDSLLPMSLTEDECGELVVKHLLAGNRGHFGPLEHPQIVLNCGWFPHSVMQQVRTHRVGISFDVQSGRYTGKRIADLGKWIHDELSIARNIQDLLEVKRTSLGQDVDAVFYQRPVGSYTDRQGKSYTHTVQDFCERRVHQAMAALRYYHEMDSGISEEDARDMIPAGYRQHFVVSCNARSLMHLLDLRAKSDAQLECQQLCELIWPHFENWVPSIAAWYKQNRWGKARLSP